MSFAMRLRIFMRSFFLQAGWNYVKYQNIGLTFVMLPFLRKLYGKEPEALRAALTRYLDVFNTQPVMASFCFGALAQQEEQLAKARSVTDFKEQLNEWVGAKRGLSITAASIGDRLFWGTLKPLTLLLAIFIWLAMGINFFEIDGLNNPPLYYAFCAGGAAFFVYNSVALFVKWEGIAVAYKAGESSCFGLTKFDWNKTIYHAKRIGIVFAVLLMLAGVYIYFQDLRFDLQFATRAVIVLFFILISLLTRRLRIPNVYLYIAATVIFNIVCYL